MDKTDCARCGNASKMASIAHDNLCLACSQGWKALRICPVCKCMEIPWDLGAKSECQGCHSGTHSFMICQTKRQVHSNWMLFMRRMMPGLAEVMAIEATPWPEYARVGDLSVRLLDGYYWRDNGQWGFEAEKRKGILVASSKRVPDLNGRPIIEITEEEWEEENG